MPRAWAMLFAVFLQLLGLLDSNAVAVKKRVETSFGKSAPYKTRSLKQSPECPASPESSVDSSGHPRHAGLDFNDYAPLQNSNDEDPPF